MASKHAVGRYICLLSAILAGAGCSRTPVPQKVSIHFICSGGSQTISVTWPVTQRDKESLQAAVRGLQHGDKVSITVGTEYRGGEYELRDASGNYEIVRTGPGNQEFTQIGPTTQKNAVLELFIGHILDDVQTAASLTRSNADSR